jgi:hypothetical protein
MWPTDWQSEEKIRRTEFDYSRRLQTTSENKNEERIKNCNKKPTKQSAETAWLHSMNGGKIIDKFVQLLTSKKIHNKRETNIRLKTH